MKFDKLVLATIEELNKLELPDNHHFYLFGRLYSINELYKSILKLIRLDKPIEFLITVTFKMELESALKETYIYATRRQP